MLLMTINSWWSLWAESKWFGDDEERMSSLSLRPENRKLEACFRGSC